MARRSHEAKSFHGGAGSIGQTASVAGGSRARLLSFALGSRLTAVDKDSRIGDGLHAAHVVTCKWTKICRASQVPRLQTGTSNLAENWQKRTCGQQVPRASHCRASGVCLVKASDASAMARIMAQLHLQQHGGREEVNDAGRPGQHPQACSAPQRKLLTCAHGTRARQITPAARQRPSSDATLDSRQLERRKNTPDVFLFNFKVLKSSDLVRQLSSCSTGVRATRRWARQPQAPRPWSRPVARGDDDGRVQLPPTADRPCRRKARGSIRFSGVFGIEPCCRKKNTNSVLPRGRALHLGHVPKYHVPCTMYRGMYRVPCTEVCTVYHVPCTM